MSTGWRRLQIAPRPKWMPSFLWHWTLRRLLYYSVKNSDDELAHMENLERY